MLNKMCFTTLKLGYTTLKMSYKAASGLYMALNCCTISTPKRDQANGSGGVAAPWAACGGGLLSIQFPHF